MTTVHELTYELLRTHGVTMIFGNPGSNELPFLAGMPDDFQYIHGLHEGAVLGMADGYSQARGEAVMVNLHAAAGTGNALGTLTNSVYSHSPLVIMAGQQVRSTVGQETMLSIVEPEILPRPLVKWSCQPTCAEDVPRAITQAIYMATLPAKGPVFLAVPYDDWAREAPAESGHLLRRRTTAGGCLSAEQLTDLVAVLDKAVNPVLLLGADVDAEGANDDAVRLAEALDAPVWLPPTTPRLSFPTRHRSFRGPLVASVDGVTKALEGHDVILVVGAPVFRYHQFEPGEYLAPGVRLLHITSDPAEAARAPMGEAYVAGIRDTLARLADAVTPGRRPKLPELPDYRVPPTSHDLVHPERLFAELRALAPADTVWVKESTSTMGEFWAQLNADRQGSFFLAASGGLGFGLPAAVGAQLAHRERQVVGLIGDGSANYGITALWTAARYEIPVITIILKNGTYGALRWFAGVLEVGEVPGMDVPGIDFVQIAQGYGVSATSVNNVDDFAAAFKSALGSGMPALIEVETALTI
ncbi:benzoylformate decarboxylase [Mycobacterium sp. 1245852.3]|uniref:benzoylformate decarboxylase n=1 Tax=Mycobacterium sp. 1245852.3 TaxID=1856860 RepID=UPI0008011DD0|nr:benzoylformate decarboxylase [Mycobacterium sp. 1245852.3]OBJ99964.1 benzoylformate decarboxylase [Mycobacterium sp. 1245852.3]